jgi:hypothetical protein
LYFKESIIDSFVCLIIGEVDDVETGVLVNIVEEEG